MTKGVGLSHRDIWFGWEDERGKKGLELHCLGGVTVTGVVFLGPSS